MSQLSCPVLIQLYFKKVNLLNPPHPHSLLFSPHHYSSQASFALFFFSTSIPLVLSVHTRRRAIYCSMGSSQGKPLKKTVSFLPSSPRLPTAPPLGVGLHDSHPHPRLDFVLCMYPQPLSVHVWESGSGGLFYGPSSRCQGHLPKKHKQL